MTSMELVEGCITRFIRTVFRSVHRRFAQVFYKKLVGSYIMKSAHKKQSDRKINETVFVLH